MKNHIFVLLLYFVFSRPANSIDEARLAQLPHEFQVDEVASAPEFRLINQRIETGDLSVLNDLKAMPIRDAELLLADYLRSPKSTSKSAIAARAMIVQIPGIWSYYEKLLNDNIDRHHGFDVRGIFTTIAAIDSVESVRLIGPYLFSPLDPMKFAAPGFHFNTVSGSAMLALHKMDFPDSPTKGVRSPGGSTDVRLWQNWWKENAQRFLGEAIPPADGAKSEQPPTPTAATPVAPLPLPRHAPTAPIPVILNAEPLPPNWYPLAAVVAVLLAIGLYYQFHRKNGP